MTQAAPAPAMNPTDCFQDDFSKQPETAPRQVHRQKDWKIQEPYDHQNPSTSTFNIIDGLRISFVLTYNMFTYCTVGITLPCPESYTWAEKVLKDISISQSELSFQTHWCDFIRFHQILSSFSLILPLPAYQSYAARCRLRQKDRSSSSVGKTRTAGTASTKSEITLQRLGNPWNRMLTKGTVPRQDNTLDLLPTSLKLVIRCLYCFGSFNFRTLRSPLHVRRCKFSMFTCHSKYEVQVTSLPRQQLGVSAPGVCNKEHCLRGHI